ncbi:hypothetical protein ACLN6N_17490 (plasmid) [Sphingomonas carotinifaciens]|uniref:hypothetical protein n=1 Tax=Sphingomonas carotinifaciens TaxID=1166323 RepID=UPI0039A28B84
MLIPILRTVAICTLLVVIGAASFNFALIGGLDQLLCALISLVAILALLASSASLQMMDRIAPFQRWIHGLTRKGGTPNAEDRG